MLPAYSLSEVQHQLAAAFKHRYPQTGKPRVRMVGLLFAPPGAPISKSEILPRLNDFHHRSGANIDFFCGGYGAYWPDGWVPDAEVVATTTDPTYCHKTKWLFSSKYFNDFRQEVVLETGSWKYSGEVDLLLLNAYPDSEELARLDFTGAVVLRLDQLKEDKVITSAPILFEQIFDYAERQSGDDPTWGFSDSMGLREGRSWFIELVMSLLPLKAGELWKKGRHYAVLNLAK
jgi:hypothetical protein